MTIGAASLRSWRTGTLILSIIIIAADQASKWWILELLADPPYAIVISEFFNLVRAWNRGVSFGLFNSDGQWNAIILSVVALVIVIALLIWLFRTDERPTIVAIGLVVGGALGNVIDRARFGAVFDFLDVHVMGWHWPAFNIADSAISIGAAVLIWDGLFGGAKPRNIPKSSAIGGDR